MATMYFTLRDEKHKRFAGAGDNYDSKIYHGDHYDSKNAQWRFDPAGDGSYYIFDRKHGKCIVAGDKYDGNVYHQDPQNRLNAKWKVVPGSVSGTFNFIDQKHGKALASGHQAGGRVLHGDTAGALNACWRLGMACKGDQWPPFYSVPQKLPTQVTLTRVKCVAPSSGLNNAARLAFEHITGILAGAVATAIGVATGGFLLDGDFISTAYQGGMMGGEKLGKTLDQEFSGADDLYVWVGSTRWPSGGHYDIDSQQTLNPNVTIALNEIVGIRLYDEDDVSSDDEVAALFVAPDHPIGTGTYLVKNDGEGSAYELTIRVS